MAATPKALTFGSLQVPLPKPLLEPLDKERYLCISDGFVIHLLDLKRSRQNNQSTCSVSHDLPSLPTISTLKLLEKGLPILAGLFKLGSDVYLIGGRKIPAFDNPTNFGINLFASLSNAHGLKGTSCATYLLSLVGGNLSMSESDSIKPLIKPKGWPRVEKMGNKLHVMECFPARLSVDAYREATLTHEVLDLDDPVRGWVEIKHARFEYGVRAEAHIVVGDWLHALAEDYPLVFDSKTEAWDQSAYTNERYVECVDPFSVELVSRILAFGRGRCVGRFLRGELSDSLYVVFAIVEHEGCVHAVAYLVAVAGQILCFQRVPHFFEGKIVGPASVMDSTVINLDDEEKTMCAIIDGKPVGNVASGCLFVYTFNVEELPGARLWIRDVWKRSVLEGKAIEKEFVRVGVKERYVYKTETDGGAESGGCRFTRMQACFL